MEMWKICLVLNNPIRFALLREIMVSPGRVQNVVLAGERLGIKKVVGEPVSEKAFGSGIADGQKVRLSCHVFVCQSAKVFSCAASDCS